MVGCILRGRYLVLRKRIKLPLKPLKAFLNREMNFMKEIKAPGKIYLYFLQQDK